MYEYDSEGMPSFILGILIVVLVICISLATWNWITYYYDHRRCNGNRSLLPSLDCSPISCYIMFFRIVYFNKLKGIHRCLIFQVICGLCKMFDKERIVCARMLNQLFVYFYKPETVKVVLSSTEAIEKSFEYQFLHPWLGTGLLTSNGDKWRSRRKLLTPTFHFQIMEDFLPIFDEQSRVLVSKLKNLEEKPWLDVVPFITMCTLDIICQTIMGVEVNAQSGGCSEYVKAIHNISEILQYRFTRPWLWSDAIFFCLPVGRKLNANLQLVHGFTKKVIKEKKSTMCVNLSESAKLTSDINSSPSVRREKKTFMELLLEHHLKDASFTEDDIREEVDTFMFRGHDTSAMAISWTLYNLGLYPDIQDKALMELDSIFEDDSSRPVTRQDLTQMKYLECIFKETLRLYPSVPIISRWISKEFTVLTDKYTIPDGSVCVICPLILHRDPESFPNPEKFDPERFFLENCNRRHPYAYVPFSAGPRNCIGQKFATMEAKTVLANVLRNFRVESLDPRDKVNVMPDLVIRNMEPLRMRFTPRR